MSCFRNSLSNPDVIPAERAAARESRNPGKSDLWMPAPRFHGGKFIPAQAGTGMTVGRLPTSSENF